MINLVKSCCLLLIVFVTVNGRDAETTTDLESNKNPLSTDRHGRQIFVGATGLETSTPDFVRLVVMRLIYGLASTMGLEERLQGALNGVFAPPNADGGAFDFGGFGGSDYGDDAAGLIGGVDDLFDFI